MRKSAFTLLSIAYLLYAGAAAGRELVAQDPSRLGFDPKRLARLDDRAREAVDDGIVAGAVLLVQRHGQPVYHRAFGVSNAATGDPMAADDLFRIASMTKPITSLGVLILFEEGHFLLDDAIGRYLPSFNRTFEVAVPTEDGFELVPAERPITIRHLLTHTSGISYRFNDVEPLTSTYENAGIDDGLGNQDITLADWTRRLAEQPLAHQPGEAWLYGLNTDVLGRLVEVTSGQRLDRFFAERIFQPLGMADTYFEVPAGKRGRIAAVHRRDRDGTLRPVADGLVIDGSDAFDVAYPYDGTIGFLSGGAGITSTAADYARFLQLLLNGGELDGVRLLGRKTVELMLANQTGHLEESAYGAAGFTLGFGLSWGPERGQIVSAGTLGWGGYFSTDGWFDPREQLIGILLTQQYPYGHRLMDTYEAAIYQALVD